MNMKRGVLFIIITSLTLCNIFAQDFSPISVKKKVAVYITGENIPENYDKVVTSKIVTAITNSGRFTVVERNELFLNALDEEYNFETENSQSVIARVGEKLGAKYVIVIEISELMEEISLSARMIEVTTSEIIASYSIESAIESAGQLGEMATFVANKILQQL